MKRESTQEILSILLLAATAFTFISLFTFHQEDYLIGDAVLNACGRIGASVSYQLLSWFGKWGAYALTASAAVWGLLLLSRRKIDAPGWKLLGLAIFLLTLAALEVAWTGDGSGHKVLPGGFYGQYFYIELLGRMSRMGSMIFLLAALTVAVLISADREFYPVAFRAGQAALDRKRWRAVYAFAGRGLAPVRWLGGLRLPEVNFPSRKPAAAPAAARKPIPITPAEKKPVKSPAPRPSDPASPEEPDEKPTSSRPPKAGMPKDDAPDDGDEPMEGAADRDGEEEVGGDAVEGPKKIDDRAPFDIKVTVAEPSPPSSGPSPPRKPVMRKNTKYQLPQLDLLQAANSNIDPLDRNIIQDTAAKIEETLRHFKIEAQVVEVQKGPVITQYEVSLAAGIKVHKIVSLADDLAMALKARSIRIVAPIPGKSTVGVEVPNRHRVTVGLRELMESREFTQSNQRLPLALGKDIAGVPLVWDLGEMPHLLIAGSTGSGKSVCINSIIINLLMNKSPDEVKLILIDPKMVELSAFEQIPHLLTPVVTDMRKAPAVLNWLVDKMEERYELLAKAGVRHLTAYNALGRKELKERLAGKMEEEAIEDTPDFLPYIVVIIDELADLMMSASKEVEASITRLSQKSRAVGIHVILATQRPSVDVITGLIKANMPCRISFQVTSKVDSRTILDRNGAEKLLGKGDMLFLPPATSNLVRSQGTFISDKEIHNVVECVRKEAEPFFDTELARFGIDAAAGSEDEDELYDQAVRHILESQRGSATLLQRQLQVGYTRASRLLELMESNGLVGPFKGSKAREVYYTIDEWEAARGRSSGNPRGGGKGGESEDEPD